MAANRVERLVYWYLRFNGYLTVTNFTVHPDHRKEPETEADILAVRFRYSKEEPEGYVFNRDPNIVIDTPIDFIVGEVKSSRCRINENSWGNPNLHHFQYAIGWMGFENDADLIEAIAQELHRLGAWCERDISVRVAAFGSEHNPDLSQRYPKILQVCHYHMVEFIYNRLTTHCNALHRENWDDFILNYVALIENNNANPEELLQWILTKENKK